MAAFDPPPGMSRLIAERLGISDEELARVANGEGWPAGMTADPVAATLMSWLAGRNASEEPARAGRERALEQAGLAVKRLQQQLGAANGRTERIAEALGACPACWGDEAACPRCGGRGRPGFAYPMKEQLLELAAPALSKLGLTIVEARQARQSAGEGMSHPR